MKFLILFWVLNCTVYVSGFWDTGTTTVAFIRTDTVPRTSFFRWQMVQPESMASTWYWWDWVDIRMRRRLNVMAGISIDMACLGSAAILNRRTLITSANYLDPHMNRQRDLRIWALGRKGEHNSPYRYRVWRVNRVLPKSLNPEHWHGPRGIHSPRHDISIIHSMDQIYIMSSPPERYHYAYRTFLTPKHKKLGDTLWFGGSGYEYLLHVAENYKIFYSYAMKSDIVDCSIYLPKWWGKFLCFMNVYNHAGAPNGGGLFDDTYITGIGCFAIRYNEERLLVFTDLRYYVDNIQLSAYLYAGQYYEYAYPQWSIVLGWFFDGNDNYPYIPTWQVQNDLYPLGKK